MTAATNPPSLVTLADIEAARERLQGVIKATATERSDTLSRMAGRPVSIKHEERQRTGSFKLRGAYNRIAALDPGTRERGVVAASAGNHAQGVALAATLVGVPSTIFMPETAAFPKVEATRSYGAEVRLVGTVVDETMDAAAAHAETTGAELIHPFADRDVIAGQGTLGLEILADAPDVETVVVPVGGGGLIAGVAAAIKARRPGVRVVGVEAAGAAGMSTSLVAGRPVVLDHVETMADGIAVKAVAESTLAHARAFVDDMVTVTEEQISGSLLLLLERLKTVVEPAGAAALAAVLAGKAGGGPGAPVAVVLSGGNIDPLVLVRVVQHGLAASGRYLLLRVPLPDRPGELARLLDHVAAIGLNVIDVEHHREGGDLSLNEVEVRLTLETRDPDHRAAVVTKLRERGYRAEQL
ncbi:MAG TPA: threonine ammonia-lyase [Acidimicrobiia bacterium]|nr:threonine ammonia-lyase [Acidimicrobiia bacterium]